MMFNDYGNSSTSWDGKLTPQNVVDFLVTIGKSAIELKSDWELWSENHRVLQGSDIFSPVRSLGRTEERYKNEIVIYKSILAARDFINPPNPQWQQTPLRHYCLDPYYNPTWIEFNKYRNTLAWHTDNISIYVAIRCGKEGVDWILNKFGDEVKRCYYDRQS